jgi:hypothetical protein
LIELVDFPPEIKEEDKGRLPKIREAWMAWGKEKGYL